MSDFSLHALASEVIRASEHADPSELAAELVARIPDEEIQTALAVMAREYVRSVIGTLRNSANNVEKRAVGSKKVSAARDAWQRLIEVPEYVPSLGSWVRLREATRSQVLEMAQHRTEQAQKNAAAARRYERIARTMQQLGSNTVGDLPPDVLAATFQPIEQEVAA